MILLVPYRIGSLHAYASGEMWMDDRGSFKDVLEDVSGRAAVSPSRRRRLWDVAVSNEKNFLSTLIARSAESSCNDDM